MIKIINNSINYWHSYFLRFTFSSFYEKFTKHFIFATFLFGLRFYILIIFYTFMSPHQDLVRVSQIAALTAGLTLGMVAYYTLLERKVIASVQRREGPNTTGPFGLIQPLADGLKLILKELESAADTATEGFDIAPIISFTISFVCWAFLPINLEIGAVIDSDYTLMLFMAISSLSIYGIFLAGWTSNSKYALLGSIRAISQFISYEIFFSLMFIPLILYSDSGSLLTIAERQLESSFIYSFLPLFIIFYIAMLVETNRAPFDMPEAEAELVAGFNVEYSSITFALFFLGEYNSMIIASTIMVLLFFNGSLWFSLNFNNYLTETNQSTFDFGYIKMFYTMYFILKILAMCYSFIFIRANFPRVRYDQLLLLGWKICLPISLSFVYAFVAINITFNGGL